MATLTIVASGTSAVVALADHPGRKGLILYNNDANAAYVLLGPGTASATNLSFVLNTDRPDAILPGCTDRVSVVWAADGSGSLFATEYE